MSSILRSASIVLLAVFCTACSWSPSSETPEMTTEESETVSYNQNSWKDMIPDTCTQFFDGCNNCSKAEGAEMAACTRKACAMYEKPECLQETLTFYIDNKLVDCVGVGPMKCMRVKYQEDEDWKNFYDKIKGFEFEEGSAYTLKVTKTKRDNVPADANAYQYELVEVLSEESTQEMDQEEESENPDISWEGRATGYTFIEEVQESFCEENCGVNQYVFFKVLDTTSEKLMEYISDPGGNSFMRDQSLLVGCLVDDVITTANHSDKFGYQEKEYNEETTTKLLNSSEENPISVEMNKYTLSGGRGAPDCYSHITELEVADEK